MIKQLRLAALAVFITGGLLSGTLGLNNLAAQAGPATGAAGQPQQLDAQASLAPATPAPAGAAHLQPTETRVAAVDPPVISGLRALLDHSATQQPPDAVGTGSWLYAIDGNLWVTDGRAPRQLTFDGTSGQPALGPDGLAFVQRSRNASEIWLGSPVGSVRPITRDASPTISQNHWASEPVFLPGRQRLYVVGDFNKYSTGVGDLAVWELGLDQQPPVQITRPPAYAGGDQDVTVNPADPRQIIFTRYTYVGTQLVEQLEWLDVSTDKLVPLTSADTPSRQASYSPDAQHIAFVQHDGAQREDLYVADVQVASGHVELDNIRRIVTGVVANPAWSADGSTVAYLAQNGDGFQLWSVTLEPDTGQPRQITKGPALDATSRPVYVTRQQADEIRQWLASPAS